MKKSQARQRPHKVKKKKPAHKKLLIKLSDGRQCDFFTLPNDMRQKLILEIPAIRNALAEMRE